MCCLLPNGELRRRFASLGPPASVTGHCHPRCYLGSTSDCSADISAEHYVSQSVLELIADRALLVGGFPWLPSDQRREISIRSLTANILCARHNSALSPLDNIAGEFAREFKSIRELSQRRSLSRKNKLILISGEAFELWMLKIACGLFYSKNASNNGTRLIDNHTIDEKLLTAALFQGKWGDGCGLYMQATQGAIRPITNTIEMVPYSDVAQKRFVGIRLILMGCLDFNLMFDPVGVNTGSLLGDGWRRRPSELVFRVESRAYTLRLTWAPGTPPLSISLHTRRRV